MDVGNVHMTNFAVKMNIAGQMHRQAKALPPETRIRQVTIRTDGRGDLGTLTGREQFGGEQLTNQ